MAQERTGVILCTQTVNLNEWQTNALKAAILMPQAKTDYANHRFCPQKNPIPLNDTNN